MARRAPLAILGGLTGIVTLAQVAYYFPRTVDDLFISLRYARNLVDGAGLVYNPGERVEGFSSPLWVLLQASGLALGFEGVLWIKLVGIASLAALLVAVFFLGRRVLGIGAPWCLVATLLVGLDSFIVSWSVLGLETPLFLALLAWTAVVAHLHVSRPGRATLLALVAVTTALFCTRPEAPVFALATWAAAALSVDGGVRRLLLPGLLVLGVAAGLLALRLGYYGELLPHTRHVKTGSPMERDALEYFLRRGCEPLECAAFVIAALGAVAMALMGRDATVLAVMATTLVFASSVNEDWMPNVRFFLPARMVAPLAWAWIADRISRAGPSGRLVGVTVIAAVLVSMMPVALTDTRFSPRDRHHDDGDWNRPKSRALLEDSLDCLARRSPAHVRDMSIQSMGMTDQIFEILEASDRPIEDSWWVGRDIGRVGWYTDVRVFDTEALFTPAIAHDPEWSRDRRPSRRLVASILDLDPVGTDLLGRWATETGRNRDLAPGWKVVRGSVASPHDLRPPHQRRPGNEEIVRRYDALEARLPRRFHLQSLYGEAVGAAIEKRARCMRTILGRGGVETTADVPPDLAGAGVHLENRSIILHGCRASPRIEPGGEGVLECWFEPRMRIPSSLWVFVHVEGPGRFVQDHLPLLGLLPTDEWQPGTVVHDVMILNPRTTQAPGTYTVRIGLFTGSRRSTAAPAHLTDGNGRIEVATIEIAHPE